MSSLNNLSYLRHLKADYSQFASPRDGVLTEKGIEDSLEWALAAICESF